MQGLLLILLITLIDAIAGQRYPPPCDHEIYCKPGNDSHPSVLHTVQMARIFPDSKTFVDMPMKFHTQTVLNNFAAFIADNPSPLKDDVKRFVDENFDEEGTEFIDWVPKDWKEHPDFFDKIADPVYVEFAKMLNERWKDLGRQIDPALKNDQDMSLIYMDHPFVVPGGRFREMYYWDSYWTILGLLLSEMHETVKGMLENFSGLVETYGHIPNGNRIYYERRSQPPLFISMMEEYYKVTKDADFIKRHLPTMEKEFQFWVENRSVEVNLGGKYQMFAYRVQVDSPRPESYYEDYRDAHKSFDDSVKDQTKFYMNMKSGAESGWDYSTRWFMNENGATTNEITDNKCMDVIPVELNSYLCKSARILSDFYNLPEVNDASKADQYQSKMEEIKTAIDQILWNDEVGTWFDFDTLNNRQKQEFYPSNIAPLWADCYPKESSRSTSSSKAARFIQYLKVTKALDFPGGVPTSLVESGQQWDLPNAWPPLHEIIITGLENTGLAEGRSMALKLAAKWIYQNWFTYNETGFMFEKYNASRLGPGAGGEYDVQEGFGWTNGVLLDLFNKYGDRVSHSYSVNFKSSPLLIVIAAILLLLFGKRF